MPGICMLTSMSLLFAMHDLNLNSPYIDFEKVICTISVVSLIKTDNYNYCFVFPLLHLLSFC